MSLVLMGAVCTLSATTSSGDTLSRRLLQCEKAPVHCVLDLADAWTTVLGIANHTPSHQLGRDHRMNTDDDDVHIYLYFARLRKPDCTSRCPPMADVSSVVCRTLGMGTANLQPPQTRCTAGPLSAPRSHIQLKRALDLRLDPRPLPLMRLLSLLEYAAGKSRGLRWKSSTENQQVL